ncbi:hypothetical protein PVAND_001247 [Polypedilum vanderplanki]|uniref:lysozyme n=1 Tax=Polypedilum vanderplanki TaxID=319348 RepID=A0A9J6BMT4_POLVA|nr:hypothetical protein PVAND_001247 [Polypedilum vanderplanki]
MKVLIVVFLLFAFSEAKAVTKCELVKALYNAGIPKAQLPDWVCLVQYESLFNTEAKYGPNKDGSYDYGIFQINSRYWCGIGKVGGECNLNCNSLLNNDISDDITCAKRIYSRHKFSAWVAWDKYCNGKPLPPISDCKI